MMNLFGGLFQFAMLRSRNFSRHSSSIVGPHKSNPLVVQKILARIMLSEMKTSRLFLIFLLSSCDVVTWKAGRRRVALASEFFLSKLERLPGRGPHRLSRNCATQILNFISCSDWFRRVIISTEPIRAADEIPR